MSFPHLIQRCNDQIGEASKIVWMFKRQQQQQSHNVEYLKAYTGEILNAFSLKSQTEKKCEM